jgi:hypothetical protein
MRNEKKQEKIEHLEHIKQEEKNWIPASAGMTKEKTSS